MTLAILEQLTRRQLVVLDQLVEQLTGPRQLDQRLLPTSPRQHQRLLPKAYRKLYTKV